MASRELAALSRPEGPQGYRVFICACGCSKLVLVTMAQIGAHRSLFEAKNPDRNYATANWYLYQHMPLLDGKLRYGSNYLSTVGAKG